MLVGNRHVVWVLIVRVCFVCTCIDYDGTWYGVGKCLSSVAVDPKVFG